MIVHTTRQLGAIVRDRRRALGLTQVEVAASAQVTRQSIASIERGKPTAELGLCLRILDALELDVDITPRSDPDDAATDRLNRALWRASDR